MRTHCMLGKSTVWLRKYRKCPHHVRRCPQSGIDGNFENPPTSPHVRPELVSAQYEHEHETNFDSAEKSASAVSKFHTHSIPLDMEDIERDWDKPVAEAGIAAKASVIVRVGMLDLGAGTGSFRVREMMHRIAYPLGVHVRADVNLTDIEASCTDGKDRITEVVDLPTPASIRNAFGCSNTSLTGST